MPIAQKSENGFDKNSSDVKNAFIKKGPTQGHCTKNKLPKNFLFELDIKSISYKMKVTWGRSYGTNKTWTKESLPESILVISVFCGWYMLGGVAFIFKNI